MVMITPPRSGSSTPEGSGSGEFLKPALASAAPLSMTFDDAVQILDPTSAPPPMPVAPAAAAARPVDLWSDTVDEVPANSGHRAPAPTTPPVKNAANLADTVDASTSGEFPPPELEAAGSYSEPLLPGEQWISPQVHVWRQWVLLGGSAVMGIALAVAVFGYAVIHATRARQAAVAQASQAGPSQATSQSDSPAAPGTDAAIDNAAATPKNAEEPSAAVADPAGAPPMDDPPPTPQATDSDEASPPAPIGDSPFEAESSPAPTEVAANSDLLDKFGDFLGTTDVASPPADGPAEPGPEPLPAETPSASASDEPPAEETPLPRPRPRHVDVAARLADPIVELEFASVPLVEFLEFLSDLSTIPISIETEALAWGGLSPNTSV
jgi:hypothetical protein